MILSKIKTFCYTITVWTAIIFTFFPFSTQAAGSGIWRGLEDCRVEGDCSLMDFVKMATNIFQFTLGIVGSLALLAFVYGGILFLFSGGNSDMIEKGKNTLKGAVIGLIVVFTSYTLVYFTTQALGMGEAGVNIFQGGGFFK